MIAITVDNGRRGRLPGSLLPPYAPPGHGTRAIEAAAGGVGAGEHDEEEADRGVHLIATKRENR